MLTDRFLVPRCRCRSLAEYEAYLASESAAASNAADHALLAAHGMEETWSAAGYSLLTKQPVEFEVDQRSGGHFEGGTWHPNLRERLVCPITGLNNRQRLICSLVNDRAFRGASIWFMEQVTPVYAWAAANLSHCAVVGSEYLGPDTPGGAVIDGIRHENCEKPSFADGSLDFIVSNEVFEHVPNPKQAFRECVRVLGKGGRMICTIPFRTGGQDTVVRAVLNERLEVEHRLEPVYHGNPVSAEGSLVFTDFGWEILDTLQECGFRDSWHDIYHAPELGHFGGGLIVLESIV